MTLEELERSITHLPPEELTRFREWFLTFDADNWDREFDADVAAGRLNAMADSAIREHRAGKSTRL